MIHTARPKRGNARKAWDVLAKRADGVPIKELWYWRSGEGNWWVCEYEDGETDEVGAECFAWEYDREIGRFVSKRRAK